MSAIDVNVLTPPQWISMDPSEYKIIAVSEDSAEYEEVDNRKFNRSITNIARVQNPFAYYRFLLRQEEYQSREIPFTIETMYHATDRCNLESIVRNNLDWRRAHRVRFGQGVSFSPFPSYANKQCNKDNSDRRVMIKCSVIVGRTAYGNYYTRIPPDSTDTTVATGNVFVKYYDDEFYPEYLLYYNN